MFFMNNIISNLRLVCPNCDSQLPTYKNRNKGNGRHSRRVRYSKGKSRNFYEADVVNYREFIRNLLSSHGKTDG